MGLRILWENEDYWAVDKPAGQEVIPGRGPATSPCLREELARAAGQTVWVVHRLDRDTSGVLVLAKNADAHRSLSVDFENRRVEKEYLAAVRGPMNVPAGLFRDPLRAFGSGRMGVDPDGKPSETQFETLETWTTGALLRVRPRTGRRHQIRVHLHHGGHPVLGDRLYGPPPRPIGGAPRLLLHAARIAFRSPAGESIAVECPLPADFRDALRIVGAGEISYLKNQS